MKPHKSVRGYLLTQGVEYDILSEFNGPIVMIQNQGAGAVTVTFNNGEPLEMSGKPFAYEPLVPISGVISTDGDNVVVFA
jgi:hypothetical protein